MRARGLAPGRTGRFAAGAGSTPRIGAETPLEVRGLVKRYARGLVRRRETFRLEADLIAQDPAIVGVMGPNGSGKSTLFELITGSNTPSAGSVRVIGRNIHDVKYRERDRLAIHYHQSYQVRHFRRSRPSFVMQPAGHEYPMVHLFDEPQFNTQDGYIGFMLDFFRKLKSEGRLVFVCLHPNEPYHLELMEEVCERCVFVLAGRVREYPNFRSMLRESDVRGYLGRLAPADEA